MKLKQTFGFNISASLKFFLWLPWFVILYFAFSQMSQYVDAIKEARHAQQSIDTSLLLGDLIYELQRERGLTAGFLASHTESSLVKLTVQRVRTNQKITHFTNLTGQNNFQSLRINSLASSQVISKAIKDSVNCAEQLSSQRKSVDLKLSQNYFYYYSSFIDKLIRLISQLQVNIEDTEQNRFNLDFINLIRLQEKSGQERGALNGLLNTAQIDISQLQQVVSYGVDQEQLIADLFAISNTHHQTWLAEQLASPVNQQVLQIRQRIYQKLIREEYLFRLEKKLGYGGLIHHFKNYVLRGETQYLQRFEADFEQVNKIIQSFSALPNLTSLEHQALSTVTKTVDQYQQQLIRAQQFKETGRTVEEIDNEVRINDKLTIDAIKHLGQYELNIEADNWWRVSSERIELFRQISEHISAEIKELVTITKTNATNRLLIYISIFTLAFITALYLSFSTVRKIIKKLKYIADAMRQMQINHKFNVPLKIDGNDEIAAMSVAFNQMLSERIKSESDLKISAAVFKYASEAIMITNEHNLIETVNPAFCAISGYSADEVIGKSPKILQSGKHTSAFYRKMWHGLTEHNCWQGEIWNKRKNGELYPEFLAISVVRDTENKPIQYISLFSDITKHKKYEEDIWLQANYDALTGLPNRKLCLERLYHAIHNENYQHNQLALLFIDLDRFKNINDSWGHNSGDELLKLASVRLSQCIRDTDTVARFGGDEFVVLLEGITNRFDIERITKNILRTLSTPFYLTPGSSEQRYEAVVSASIGITVAPTDGNSVELLLKNADTAMYQAKESGRNDYKFFTHSMNKTVTARMKLEQALRAAVKQKAFVLHYQPVVSLATGNIIGAEALIRWQHPTEGLVYPDQFIGIAEETGLIEAIGEWVIVQACQDLKHWHSIGLNLQVAVNVSSKQCKQTSKKKIYDIIDEALTLNSLEPASLKVEITESLLMDNSQEMISTLQKIRNLGVAIHMDDFGTGYSSLSYLKHFPIDVLKIDRAFIEGAIDDQTDASLVEAVVLIGHSLKLKLVGEGIETQQHFDYLRSLGCDYGQGYHISRPIEVANFIKLCQQPHSL